MRYPRGCVERQYITWTNGNKHGYCAKCYLGYERNPFSVGDPKVERSGFPRPLSDSFLEFAVSPINAAAFSPCLPTRPTRAGCGWVHCSCGWEFGSVAALWWLPASARKLGPISCLTGESNGATTARLRLPFPAGLAQILYQHSSTFFISWHLWGGSREAHNFEL